MQFRGKQLLCHCKEGLGCHKEVLLELLNEFPYEGTMYEPVEETLAAHEK